MAKLFFIYVTIGIPLSFFISALIRRQLLIFIAGVSAFVGSQLLFRLPLLQLLTENSTYQLLLVTRPIYVLLFLSLTAGIVEELARWILLRYVIKSHSLQTGIIFVGGHGSIEAIVLVAVPMLSSTTMMLQSNTLIISSIERLLAMEIHICLTVIVLISVRQRTFRYCMYALCIHAAINFTTAYVATFYSAVAAELILLLLVTSLTIYTIYIWRRNHNEKMEHVIK